MLAALRMRRWQGFTVVVLVAIIGFGLLSRWQWQRAEEKRVAQQAQTLAEQEARCTSGRRTASGIYRCHPHRRIRSRLLATLFVNARWKAATGIGCWNCCRPNPAIFWVLRGWVPAGPRSDISPDVSSPPGQITVDGLVRPLPRGEELTDRGGLPGDQGHRRRIGSAAYAGQTLIGMCKHSTQNPKIPSPSCRSLGPMNCQNVSYAVQWLLFAAVAIGGWFYFLRREAKELD